MGRESRRGREVVFGHLGALTFVFALLTTACDGHVTTAQHHSPEIAASTSPQSLVPQGRLGRDRLFDVVRRALQGWDRHSDRAVRLLGMEPTIELVPGREFVSIGAAKKIPDGWEIPVILASYREPFPYRDVRVAVLGRGHTTRVVVRTLSNLGTVRSSAAAVKALDDHLAIPVVLPDIGARRVTYFIRRFSTYAGRRGIDREGSVVLKMSAGRTLAIEYGMPSFDGCDSGGALSEEQVLDKPALMESAPDGRSHHLIWPAKPPDGDGRYGLAGSFSAARLIRWATQMERERRQVKRSPPIGPYFAELGC